MAQTATLVIRAALEGEASIYRDIEIEATKSLYRLAEAITAAFGFDFDHAFGFYSGLTDRAMYRQSPKYELFADIGEADEGVLSVKKAKVGEAYPAVGQKLMFLFDYGDEWRFRTTLVKNGEKVAKLRYPRVVAAKGEAPEQYPEPEEDEEGQARFG
jgi:hypothetical protein